MAKARKTTRKKARKSALKARTAKRRTTTARKSAAPKRRPTRKRRAKPQGVVDRLSRAAGIVADSMEEAGKMREKYGARGGLSDG